MESLLFLDSREQKLTFDLIEALNSSLKLSEVLSRAYEILSHLLSADYVAICISQPGRKADRDWIVAAIPPEHFARSQDKASEAGVRQVMTQHPNTALRDTEMPPSEDMERQVLQQRGREGGMPREHVMAVLLDAGRDWHGGFMLFRDQRQPFSERERTLMQFITPLLTSTVRNCRQMGEMTEQHRVMEHLLQFQGMESIVVTPEGTEWMRTPGATALLETWFKNETRAVGGLPEVLMERLRVLTSGRKVVGAERGPPLVIKGVEKSLQVSFVPIPESGSGQLWGLLFQEVSDKKVLPKAWCDVLTTREAQVAECALQGWDNQTIAEHLNCSVGTVKKHLQRVFDKMGVDTRTALMNRAARM